LPATRSERKLWNYGRWMALKCECSMPAEQSLVLNVMNNCNFLRMLDLLAVWHCKIEISSHHESALWVTLYCFCTSAVAVCAWRHQYLFYTGIFPTRNWICAIYFCRDLLVGLLITACRCHCTHCLISEWRWFLSWWLGWHSSHQSLLGDIAVLYWVDEFHVNPSCRPKWKVWLIRICEFCFEVLAEDKNVSGKWTNWRWFINHNKID